MIMNFTILRNRSITLGPISYLRFLVSRARHRHRTGAGLIPIEDLIYIVDEFFRTVSDSIYDMCITHSTLVEVLLVRTGFSCKYVPIDQCA